MTAVETSSSFLALPLEDAEPYLAAYAALNRPLRQSPKPPPNHTPPPSWVIRREERDSEKWPYLAVIFSVGCLANALSIIQSALRLQPLSLVNPRAKKHVLFRALVLV